MTQNFQKHHLVIDKSHFHLCELESTYSYQHEDLNICEILPELSLYTKLLKRVGGPWYWTHRPKYFGKEREIEFRLKEPKSRLFLLRKNESVIGYCLVTPTDFEATRVLFENGYIESYSKVIEIENFGLFPEHTGQKFGRFFLPQIFKTLFQNYNIVYLTTRSTNHERVVPFYLDMGMSLIKTETLPNDLVGVKEQKKAA